MIKVSRNKEERGQFVRLNHQNSQKRISLDDNSPRLSLHTNSRSSLSFSGEENYVANNATGTQPIITAQAHASLFLKVIIDQQNNSAKKLQNATGGELAGYENAIQNIQNIQNAINGDVHAQLKVAFLGKDGTPTQQSRTEYWVHRIKLSGEHEKFNSTEQAQFQILLSKVAKKSKKTRLGEALKSATVPVQKKNFKEGKTSKAKRRVIQAASNSAWITLHALTGFLSVPIGTVAAYAGDHFGDKYILKCARKDHANMLATINEQTTYARLVDPDYYNDYAIALEELSSSSQK